MFWHPIYLGQLIAPLDVLYLLLRNIGCVAEEHSLGILIILCQLGDGETEVNGLVACWLRPEKEIFGYLGSGYVYHLPDGQDTAQ